MLQENGRAKLVGEKTFGKGVIQNLQELRQGGIAVTIAKYETPLHNNINKVGAVTLSLRREDIQREGYPLFLFLFIYSCLLFFFPSSFNSHTFLIPPFIPIFFLLFSLLLVLRDVMVCDVM